MEAEEVKKEDLCGCNNAGSHESWEVIDKMRALNQVLETAHKGRQMLGDRNSDKLIALATLKLITLVELL